MQTLNKPIIQHYYSFFRNSLLYLLLSLFSGIIETGILIYGISQYNVLTGLSFVLAYQIGCLFKNPINVSLNFTFILQIISLLLSYYSVTNPIMTFIVICLLSSGVQGIREITSPKDKKTPEWVKRSFRVIGFTLGILFGSYNSFHFFRYIIISILIINLYLILYSKTNKWKITINKNVKLHNCGWIMFFHQSHYFAYAYVLISYFYMLDLKLSILNKIPLLTILFFFGGWITYISGEWVLNDKLKLTTLKALIGGHLLVFICIFFMILKYNSAFIFGSLWIIGGLGGGSIYAVKKFLKDTDSTIDIELWENWGHIFGIGLSITFLFLIPKATNIPYMIALISVSLTLLSLMISLRKNIIKTNK